MICHEGYEILGRKRLGEKVALLIIAPKLFHLIFHIYILYAFDYTEYIKIPQVQAFIEMIKICSA